MPMLRCEVDDGGSWVEIGTDDPRATGQAFRKRCIECVGAVRRYQESGKTPFFEHMQAWSGCPLSKHNFSGKAAAHPAALY